MHTSHIITCGALVTTQQLTTPPTQWWAFNSPPHLCALLHTHVALSLPLVHVRRAVSTSHPRASSPTRLLLSTAHTSAYPTRSACLASRHHPGHLRSSACVNLASISVCACHPPGWKTTPLACACVLRKQQPPRCGSHVQWVKAGHKTRVKVALIGCVCESHRARTHTSAQPVRLLHTRPPVRLKCCLCAERHGVVGATITRQQ